MTLDNHTITLAIPVLTLNKHKYKDYPLPIIHNIDKYTRITKAYPPPPQLLTHIVDREDAPEEMTLASCLFYPCDGQDWTAGPVR